MSDTGAAFPVVFIPHGGGPWPFVDFGVDPGEVQHLAAYLKSLSRLTAKPPRAVLVVSAHWEESVPTLMTGENPPLLFDYYGFPPASYRLTWPAPGAPFLVPRVRELLAAAGFASAVDSARGYDHGTFIPLKVIYPDAEIPILQLSLLSSLDPEEHLRLGRALRPLRDEGILILGSGMSFHNLRAFRQPSGREISESFDRWLREIVTLDAHRRDHGLVHWELSPSARAAHPREEHLLPLMVVAGAAGADPGVIAYNDLFMGIRLSGVQFG